MEATGLSNSRLLGDMEPSGPSRDGPLEGQTSADMVQWGLVEEEPSCSLLLQMSVEEGGGPETPQGSSVFPTPICF